jgi:hypothetical protein
MSLRYEQYWSLKKTHAFLQELILMRGRISLPELRRRALSCLRHYPPLHENGRPDWSKDEFTKD